MSVAPASIRVDRLTFRYPGAEDPALTDVTFEIAPGERVGLLGPNGAGKSTLMRLLCGYLPVPPSRGTSVVVGGLDVAESSLEVRARVGYLPEQVPLYHELRVREHLDFRARIKRLRRRQRPEELTRVARQAGLDGMLEVPIGRLSRGYRQRVGIADALLGSPPLVVLDEPTVGLDPNQVQGIRAMLRRLGGAQTLLFSSHILAEVEALCDRILILSRGRVVADEALTDAIRSPRITAELVGSPAQVRAVVGSAWRAAKREGEVPLALEPLEGGVCRIKVDAGGAELRRALGKAALDDGVAVVRLEQGRRPLEERFARVTGALEEEAAP